MTVVGERRGAYREGNSTADRALTILQMFTEERSQISASEVAEHLGVSRSTAYRYAQSLVRSAFLSEVAGSGFRLGPRVMELARIARRSFGLSDMAIPLMRELANRFHETIILTKRIDARILCLEREEWPGQHVRLSYERGSRLPLNAGASALILLAWLPEAEVRELIRSEKLHAYTPSTLVDADAIVTRLDQVRRDGYCVAQGELDPDAAAVAAPVFDSEGQVCAGLSLVTLSSRLSNGALDAVIEGVKAAAQRLSQTLSDYAG